MKYMLELMKWINDERGTILVPDRNRFRETVFFLSKIRSPDPGTEWCTIAGSGSGTQFG